MADYPVYVPEPAEKLTFEEVISKLNPAFTTGQIPEKGIRIVSVSDQQDWAK